MAQFQWLKKQLKNSKATWKLVFGHHHIFTASMTNKWMRQNVVPLFEKYKVSIPNARALCFSYLIHHLIHPDPNYDEIQY